MSFRIKQTQSELRANIDAFEESIKPAVLLSAPVGASPSVQAKAQANVDSIKSWMIANTSDENGVVDYNVENLRRGYRQLKAAGVLHFSVAPASNVPKQMLGAEVRGLRNHAAPPDDAPKGKNPMELARDAAMKMQVNQAWDACQNFVNISRGRTHGGTARVREALQLILDAAKKGSNPTSLAAAHACKEALKKKADAMWG
jgi:hypothetical protein